MGENTPRSIVLKFIEYVNAGDLEAMNALIADDVKFTDIAGDVYIDKEFMENYLANYPDYKIHVHHALQGGNGAAIIGQTSSSHVAPEIEKNEILIWTAEVRTGLISEWRIYADDGYAGRAS